MIIFIFSIFIIQSFCSVYVSFGFESSWYWWTKKLLLWNDRINIYFFSSLGSLFLWNNLTHSHIMSSASLSSGIYMSTIVFPLAGSGSCQRERWVNWNREISTFLYLSCYLPSIFHEKISPFPTFPQWRNIFFDNLRLENCEIGPNIFLKLDEDPYSTFLQ